MRLCINNKGERQDSQTVGDAVHDINKLTIIASESYESFAQGLQKEIADTLKDRPTKVTVDFLANKVLTNDRGDKYRISTQIAQNIYNQLLFDRVINPMGEVTEDGRTKIDNEEITLPLELQPFKNEVAQLLKSVYTKSEIVIENGHHTLQNKLNKNFHREEFKKLWEKINRRSIYRVQYDSDILIENCVNKINKELKVSDRRYEVRTGSLEESNVEKLKNNDGFTEESTVTEKVGIMHTETTFDFIGEIEKRTRLTRRTIGTIIKKLKPTTFVLIQKNPEAFIAKCAILMNEVKASLILDNINYFKTNNTYDRLTIFATDKSVLRQDKKLKRHIYDYILTDSNTEREMVKQLETADEVLIYAKIPTSFKIPTPVGNFSPDWAIVLNHEKVKHIYFVVETKGSDSEQELREIEKLKIHCATEHFKAISNSEVKFTQVSSYKTLMDIIKLK